MFMTKSLSLGIKTKNEGGLLAWPSSGRIRPIGIFEAGPFDRISQIRETTEETSPIDATIYPEVNHHDFAALVFFRQEFLQRPEEGPLGNPTYVSDFSIIHVSKFNSRGFSVRSFSKQSL